MNLANQKVEYENKHNQIQYVSSLKHPLTVDNFNAGNQTITLKIKLQGSKATSRGIFSNFAPPPVSTENHVRPEAPCPGEVLY